MGILKTLPGIRKYVAIDGGMSDNIRTALYHADYEPAIANKAGPTAATEIVTHVRQALRKRRRRGHRHAAAEASTVRRHRVPCSAPARTTTTMASNYNGQPRPAVVFVRDGASRVVTRRETYEGQLYQRDL